MRIAPSQTWATLFTFGVLAAVGCRESGELDSSASGDTRVPPAVDDKTPPSSVDKPMPPGVVPPSVEMTPPPKVDTQPPPVTEPEPAKVVYALERVSNCDEAADLIRKRAIAAMNAAIDARKKTPLGGICFTPTASVPSSAAGTPPPNSAPGAAQNDSNAASGASATSMTNNQVAGVDEADFIKNDTKYVYAALNGSLRIVQAWPAAESREVANVKLEGTPKKLFVLNDRALVYVSVPRTAASQGQTADSLYYAGQSECTYGYDCQFGGDGTATALLVFDITDRAAPKQIRRIDLSGSLLAARRIGSAVHTVAVTPELTFPGLSYTIPADNTCNPQIQSAEREAQYEALRKKNTEIIEKAALSDFLPSVRDNGVDYAQDDCDSLYRELEPTGTAFTTLVSVDMAAASEPVVATVLSKPGAVYASGEALYMSVIADEAHPTAAAIPPGGALVAPPPQTERKLVSAIHKFAISADPTATAYLASGKVKGHVLNQFSMDEYKGHLRVATSWGKVPSPDVHSTMSVLAQSEGKLNVVGIVDKIAPSEDIRSVRFSADRGFIVTFKKTDPLYAFDLSVPSTPKITGELKIPGFSTYMHMLDDTHLLTIGYDAADQGNFAFFTGVLLQIFDVSDPANLKLAHKVVIGSRGSSSEALTNHLAFTLFQGKLALPMTICEGGDTNGQFGTNMTFSGLMLFDVSVADGLKERGRVAHPSASGQYDNNGCSNWWTRASSVVQRSVFMDNFVYSIAQDVMRVQNLDKLGTDVASVALNKP